MADVEFFWDPVCPWAWLTSRWMVEVASLRELEVDWRFIALRLVNAERDYATKFAAGYERGHTRGLEVLRVAAAARHAHGPKQIGDFYTAVGRVIHVEGRAKELDDPERKVTRQALASAGLPGELADAADNPAWDDVVGADTAIALERTGKDVGTPIITWEPPFGPSFFGPVLSRVPRGQEALWLWDAITVLVHQRGFFELKRSKRERPEMTG